VPRFQKITDAVQRLLWVLLYTADRGSRFLHITGTFILQGIILRKTKRNPPAKLHGILMLRSSMKLHCCDNHKRHFTCFFSGAEGYIILPSSTA
jgi:hypothetical protein